MAKNHNSATQSWTTSGREEPNWLSPLPVSIRVEPAAKPSWEVACIGLIMAVLGASFGLSSPADAAMPPLEQGGANAVKAQAQVRYGELSLSFEANQGQADAQVRYLARGPGYGLYLTPEEAVLVLKKPTKTKGPLSKAATPPAPGRVVRLQFLGANPSPQVQGQTLLPGEVNYLIGRDPTKWRTHIPTYAKVSYAQVYPGVDLVYYGRQGQLEYDLVVAPGADPQCIRLAFAGMDSLELAPHGELVLHTGEGDLRLHKPVIYQMVNGQRRGVGGGYVFKGQGRVGFEIAAYDPARPLVIDPVLVYSTYLGGSGRDSGQGIAVDNRGQAYVTGSTTSSDFPTHNALQPALDGGEAGDAFVAKLTADGAAFLYSTYLGGSGSDGGFGIGVDGRGQAYVTGFTISSDFPTHNALQPAFGGGLDDAFVAKIEP
jgi:hypothetical protein